MIYARNPVHSLLALITVFFTTVLLYLAAGAEFLAFLFLIVYVGAIAILFLFVIILLQLNTDVVRKQNVIIISSAALIIALFVDLCSQLFNESFFELPQIGSELNQLLYYIKYTFSDILIFSNTLYTTYSFFFFLAAILLLTAMLGAISLAISSVTEKIND
jgi:NADH-quinone oxidoreductase subunit J